MKKNIAIDGPAGSGKSTISKILAKEINYIYINTGLMYRAIAYNAIQKNIDLFNESDVVDSFKPGMIKLLEDEIVELNGVILEKEKLRDDKISIGASTIAVYNQVRKNCVIEQRKIAIQGGVVMDGRDITSVVLPNADLKLFISASPEERAKRRMDQNKEMGCFVNYDKILSEINARDFQDKNREIGPLIQVPDAVSIDTTDMSITEVVDKIKMML